MYTNAVVHVYRFCFFARFVCIGGNVFFCNSASVTSLMRQIVDILLVSMTCVLV